MTKGFVIYLNVNEIKMEIIMANNLAAIRAKLAEQQAKLGNNGGNNDKTLFPHWNIEEGQSALVRFLPDADTSNDFFWIERLQIKLPFAGIKGQSDKHVIVTVPCMEQWNEACPVLAEVRQWFKDKSLEEVARKYWKKRSYILQGFVRENPKDDEEVENPIRKFVLTPELFKLVREGIMDPEIEEMPVDFERGLDFRIKKGSKGGFPDYGTSSWARKETALTMEEREAIEKHGLYDLKTFLTKKPTEVELNVIRDMFKASVDGEQYDPELWATYYKPFGFNENKSATTETVVSNKPSLNSQYKKLEAEKVDNETTEVPEVVEPSDAGNNSARAQAILDKIRARKQ
jgi:hypothetical protein